MGMVIIVVDITTHGRYGVVSCDSHAMRVLITVVLSLLSVNVS